MKYQAIIDGKAYTVVRHLSLDGGRTYKLWDEYSDEQTALFRQTASAQISRAISDVIYLSGKEYLKLIEKEPPK